MNPGFLVRKCLNLINSYRRKIGATTMVLAALAGGLFYFAYALGAVSDSSAPTRVFEVKSGDGFRYIVYRLESEGLIRSSSAFKILSLATGSAFKLKPGLYKLSSSMTSLEILNELIIGSRREIVIKIPEGANVYEIDRILGEKGVIKKEGLLVKVLEGKIEGRLFPDTYKFFTDSEPDEIISKFLANFELKTRGLSKNGITNGDLILASLLEKEVPDPEEQKIVAGILKKRSEIGIPLQVDATICYIKVIFKPDDNSNCYPLSVLDFKIDSPYNTYLYRGLPPGPIGNPSVSALEAAVNPATSPYLFYLSDPKTRKTVFSKTLEEHIKNKARYLQT